VLVSDGPGAFGGGGLRLEEKLISLERARGPTQPVRFLLPQREGPRQRAQVHLRSAANRSRVRELGFISNFNRLNEQNNRDCDYIISVNFVTFLILWKIGKHQESKRYLEINRKLIELLLDEDPTLLNDLDTYDKALDDGSSSLSVIMESSHQTLNKQSLVSLENDDIKDRVNEERSKER